MNVELGRAVEVLERTPAVLRSLLGGLGDFWILGNYGENTFSPFDVVGHLIEADQTNWMTRLRVILEHGETKPFPAFDRYGMYETSKGRTMDDLLESFASLRARSLDDLKALNLTPKQLDIRGAHPAFGEVTIRQLIAAWVVHDLGHLHQVAKAMAFQCRDAVGPWREYLTILPRT
ncbi:DinB family protein [Zavarzinella formosa]|uniref:DinB family protein n=1 Tax=Zavarzinella formosa TaxID=360055 RepID=UPI00030B6EA8|nr:DinB family protein [Zavarzinella formosa]